MLKLKKVLLFSEKLLMFGLSTLFGGWAGAGLQKFPILSEKLLLFDMLPLKLGLGLNGGPMEVSELGFDIVVLLSPNVACMMGLLDSW